MVDNKSKKIEKVKSLKIIFSDWTEKMIFFVLMQRFVNLQSVTYERKAILSEQKPCWGEFEERF